MLIFVCMESMKEGGSTVRPPLFDGSFYSYWKVRMSSFVKSIEETTWSSIETRCEEPVDNVGVKKPRD